MVLPLVITVSLLADPLAAERPVPAYATGARFDETLREDLTATWENVELRSLTRRLSADRNIAILIDRRIDPNSPLKIHLTGTSLKSGLATIAEGVDATVSVTPNVVYLGPAETAHWLLTTIERREEELDDAARKTPEKRRLDLLQRRTVHWQDLETPREIIDRIAQHDGIAIRESERIPHDLWASATLPQVTAAEALELVLCQFELDFRWESGAREITIVPAQQPELLVRRYPPRGKASVVETLAKWKAAWPDLDIQAAGSELVVRARAEDHQAIRANQLNKTAEKKPAAVVPLSRRKFTLQVENVPLSAVLKELEKTGIEFHFDASSLKTEELDLEQRVSLDVKRVDAQEFLDRLFAPTSMKATYRDATVTLTAAKSVQ